MKKKEKKRKEKKRPLTMNFTHSAYTLKQFKTRVMFVTEEINGTRAAIIIKFAFGSSIGDKIFKLEFVTFQKLIINFVDFQKKIKIDEKVQFN